MCSVMVIVLYWHLSIDVYKLNFERRAMCDYHAALIDITLRQAPSVKHYIVVPSDNWNEGDMKL